MDIVKWKFYEFLYLQILLKSIIFSLFYENSERLSACDSFSQKLLLDIQVGSEYFLNKNKFFCISIFGS